MPSIWQHSKIIFGNESNQLYIKNRSDIKKNGFVFMITTQRVKIMIHVRIVTNSFEIVVFLLSRCRCCCFLCSVAVTLSLSSCDVFLAVCTDFLFHLFKEMWTNFRAKTINYLFVPLQRHRIFISDSMKRDHKKKKHIDAMNPPNLYHL